MKKASHDSHKIYFALTILVVLVAVFFKFRYALNKSLFIDDFCSLYISTQAGLSGVFSEVKKDISPPLYYLTLKAFITIFGDGELSLRMPGLIAGLLNIVILWKLCVTHFSARIGLAAVALFSFSSLHLEIDSLVRPYSFLSLMVTGLVSECMRITKSQGRFPWLPVWIFLGFHAHYYFMHYAVFATMATAIWLLCRYGLRRKFVNFVALCSVGAALCIPWFLIGFRHQWQHGPDPVSLSSSWLMPIESMVHLVYHNVSIAGPGFIYFLYPSIIILLGLMSISVVLAFFRRPLEGGRIGAIIVAIVGVGVLAWSWLVAKLSSKFGYNWSYISASAAFFCLLVSLPIDSPLVSGWRSSCKKLIDVGFIYVVAVAIALVAMLSGSPGVEDYRSAVGYVISNAQKNDAVISVEWTPAQFPQGLPWDYYSKRLGYSREEGPVRIEANANEPESFNRIFIVNRNVPRSNRVFRNVSSAFPTEEVVPFGYSLRVHIFSK